MSFELDGENPPGVLSEVVTCRCAPFNQCDTKSCSDGINVIIATTLFMYQVDYNKLQLSYPILDDNILLDLCCNLVLCVFVFRYTSGSFLVNWAPKKILATKYNALGSKHFPAIKVLWRENVYCQRVVFSGKDFFGAQFTRNFHLRNENF